MPVKIPLTQGKFAIVDDEWADRINMDLWHYCRQNGYARLGYRYGGKQKFFYMHRLIMGVAWEGASALVVDHINGDKLDNRTANLRLCTQAENLRAFHERKKAKNASQKPVLEC